MTGHAGIPIGQGRAESAALGVEEVRRSRLVVARPRQA
jgi:hypothetical protein